MISPQHKKEHNFAALLFTALVLVAALVGGAKGHTQREATLLTVKPTASATADKPVPAGQAAAPAIMKSAAFLLNTTQAPTLLPSISAAAALVEDIDSGKILYDLHSDKQWSAASLTKLVTAVSAIESFGDDPNIKVSASAIATESAAGYLVAGRSYELAELLRAMLVFSSNDAAAAISEYFGKGAFVEMLNKKASEIGMANSRFFDPHGLTPLNLTTARDLKSLVHYIYDAHRDIFDITREKIEGATHPFAGQEDFLGGKTGFIDESAGNLISLFRYQGRPVVIIVLGSKQRAEDTQILKDWFLN
ncbi:MAG: serine hydrolase [bacterium]|nr:serine hydrolase [bacterium]